MPHPKRVDPASVALQRSDCLPPTGPTRDHRQSRGSKGPGLLFQNWCPGLDRCGQKGNPGDSGQRMKNPCQWHGRRAVVRPASAWGGFPLFREKNGGQVLRICRRCDFGRSIRLFLFQLRMPERCLGFTGFRVSERAAGGNSGSCPAGRVSRPTGFSPLLTPKIRNEPKFGSPRTGISFPRTDASGRQHRPGQPSGKSQWAVPRTSPVRIASTTFSSCRNCRDSAWKAAATRYCCVSNTSIRDWTRKSRQ